jgi:hypothetical protein
VQLEGLGQLKNPVASLVLELVTFWIVHLEIYYQHYIKKEFCLQINVLGKFLYA